MSKYFCTFTDFKSLQEFISLRPIDDDPDNLKVENWRHCHRFLANDTSYNLNEEHFPIINSKEPVYPLLRKLANCYYGGDNSIQLHQDFDKLTPKEFVSINNNPKFIVTDTSNLLNLGEDNTGCIIKKPSELIDSWHLLSNDRLFNISKVQGESERLTSWNQIINNVLPLNAIVIYDNYILSNYYNMRDNLFELLRVLLSSKTKLKVPVDITIISYLFYKNKKTGEAETSIDEVFKTIKNKISKILGTQYFNFTLIKLLKQGHKNRYIYTNYFEIDSGSGFNLFNDAGETIFSDIEKINIIPITKNNQQTKVYQDHLNTIKQTIKGIPVCNIRGSNKNRLLDI